MCLLQERWFHRDVLRQQPFRGRTTAPTNSLAVARIAGIQAAKRTADIIPLCHPLLLSKVAVDLTVEESSVVIEAVVETTGPTGVEMEALHACTAAALTIYDMCKALDRAMVISDVILIEKSGGRSGDFLRSD